VAQYREWGCATSEFVEADDGKSLFAAFMHCTSHSHDIALVRHGVQPSLGHLSFWVGDHYQVIRATDILADAGHSKSIEFGPGRHLTTNSFFVYVRDPFGNRLELFCDGEWVPDMDAEPVKWTFADFVRAGRLSWGGKAPDAFFEQIPVGHIFPEDARSSDLP